MKPGESIEIEVGPRGPWRVERLAALDQVREPWDGLAEATGHPFATWEWIEPRWRSLGGARELYAFACRDREGELRAILPMYVASSRPVRTARFISYGSVNSPVCAPEDREAAARATRAVLGPGRDRCRLLYAEKMPGRQGWAEMLRARVVAEHEDPLIHLDGRSWDDFLAGRSKRRRKKIRSEERRLGREHELVVRRTTEPDRLGADMDILFRLHGRRWEGESTGVFEAERGVMHREIAAGMLERGWLRLWIEEVDGVPAAAYYSFRFANSEWLYGSGRDPRFDRLSVGGVLLSNVIRDACDDGVEDFRFLEGGESYKLELADDDYRPQSLLLGEGMLARAALVAVSAVQKAPDGVRARVMRFAR